MIIDSKHNCLTIHKGARLCCLALFLFFVIPASSQERLIDTTSIIEVTPQVTKEHSAKTALILSAVLPGAGQVYNHQVWKVPIVYAALGGLGYYAYTNFTQMKLYKEEYLHRVNNNNAVLHTEDVNIAAAPTSNIYNLYEAYNRSFQLAVIVTAAVYAINIVDAYVFGHLFDFQISDDLSLNVAPSVTPIMGLPSAMTFAPTATLSLRF